MILFQIVLTVRNPRICHGRDFKAQQEKIASAVTDALCSELMLGSQVNEAFSQAAFNGPFVVVKIEEGTSNNVRVTQVRPLNVRSKRRTKNDSGSRPSVSPRWLIDMNDRGHEALRDLVMKAVNDSLKHALPKAAFAFARASSTPAERQNNDRPAVRPTPGKSRPSGQNYPGPSHAGASFSK